MDIESRERLEKHQRKVILVGEKFESVLVASQEYFLLRMQRTDEMNSRENFLSNALGARMRKRERRKGRSFIRAAEIFGRPSGRGAGRLAARVINLRRPSVRLPPKGRNYTE